jgi:hypothetical protein
MKKFLLTLLFFVPAALILDVVAQCNQFTKKECMPELTKSGFTHNGQFNSVDLAPGESAELDFPMLAGMDYKVVVCGDAKLGKLQFIVKDKKGNLVFDNKDREFINYWEFKSETTQPVSMEVIVPSKKKSPNDIAVQGCVSVVIGYKS